MQKLQTTEDVRKSQRPPQRGRSSPSQPRAQSAAHDSEGQGGLRLSAQELYALSLQLRQLALQYAPAERPTTADLITDELFAASQAAGYRIAEDPFTALLGLSRALKRSAQHRKSAQREVTS